MQEKKMQEPTFISSVLKLSNVLQVGQADIYSMGKQILDRWSENRYSKKDEKIIRDLRQVYAGVFGDAAELPRPLKFLHELSKESGESISGDVLRPPTVLPEEYTLTQFPLGDGLLSDLCRMGIGRIISYLNERNSRWSGGGYKNDARAQVLNLLIHPLIALSSMDLDNPSTLKEAQNYISFLKQINVRSNLFPVGHTTRLRGKDAGTTQQTIIAVLAVYELIEQALQNIQKQKDARTHFKIIVAQTLDLLAKGFLYLSRNASSEIIAETVTLTSVALAQISKEKSELISPPLRRFCVASTTGTMLDRHMGGLAGAICQNVSLLKNFSGEIFVRTLLEEEHKEVERESKTKERSPEGAIETKARVSSRSIAPSSPVRDHSKSFFSPPSYSLSSPAVFSPRRLESPVFRYDEYTQKWIGNLSGECLLTDTAGGIYGPFQKNKEFMPYFLKLGGLFEKLGEAMGIATGLSSIGGDGGSVLTYLGLGHQVDEMVKIYLSLIEGIEQCYDKLNKVAQKEQIRIQQLLTRTSAEEAWLANHNSIEKLLATKGILVVAEALKETLAAVNKDYQEWRQRPEDKLGQIIENCMLLIVRVDALGKSLAPFDLKYRYDASKMQDAEILKKLGEMLYALAGAVNIPGLQRQVTEALEKEGLLRLDVPKDSKRILALSETSEALEITKLKAEYKKLEEDHRELKENFSTMSSVKYQPITTMAVGETKKEQKEQKQSPKIAFFYMEKTVSDLKVIVNNQVNELAGFSSDDCKIARRYLGEGRKIENWKTIQITKNIKTEEAFEHSLGNLAHLSGVIDTLASFVDIFNAWDSIFIGRDELAINRKFRLAFIDRMMHRLDQNLGFPGEAAKAYRARQKQFISQLIAYLKTQKFSALSCFVRHGATDFNLRIEARIAVLVKKLSQNLAEDKKQHESKDTTRVVVPQSVIAQPVAISQPASAPLVGKNYIPTLARISGSAEKVTLPIAETLPDATSQQLVISTINLIMQFAGSIKDCIEKCYEGNKINLNKVQLEEKRIHEDLRLLDGSIKFCDSLPNSEIHKFAEDMEKFYVAISNLKDIKDRFKYMKGIIEVLKNKFPMKETTDTASDSHHRRLMS